MVRTILESLMNKNLNFLIYLIQKLDSFWSIYVSKVVWLKSGKPIQPSFLTLSPLELNSGISLSLSSAVSLRRKTTKWSRIFSRLTLTQKPKRKFLKVSAIFGIEQGGWQWTLKDFLNCSKKKNFLFESISDLEAGSINVGKIYFGVLLYPYSFCRFIKSTYH